MSVWAIGIAATGAAVSGVASGVGGAIGGSKQAGAAKYAADTQLAGTKLSIEEQRRQFDAYKQLLEPYVNVGNAAITRLQDLLGLGQTENQYFRPDGTQLTVAEIAKYKNELAAQNVAQTINESGGVPFWVDQKGNIVERPTSGFLKDVKFGGTLPGELKKENRSIPVPGLSEEFQDVTMTSLTAEQKQQQIIEQLRNDPMLANQIQLGEEAILSNQAATGGLRGGDTQAALAQFAPAMLQQRINQEISNLFGLSGIGANAAAGVGNAGMTTGANIGNLINQGYGAQADAILAKGAVGANIANSIGMGFGAFGQLGGTIAGIDLGAKAMGKPGLFPGEF